MTEIAGLGKILVLFGLILVIIGIFLMYVNKMPFIGKLPGDIYLKKGNFSFYFPITTSVLLSIIISLIFFFMGNKR